MNQRLLINQSRYKMMKLQKEQQQVKDQHAYWSIEEE